MKADPTDWLLEVDNPSVRFLALRHLKGLPDEAAEVVATRAASARSPAVERIFARQAPGGYWGDPDSPYLPKYKATCWTVMLLGLLGLSREDERVQRAVEYLFRFQQPVGGFSEHGEVVARREYALAAGRWQTQGRRPPDESAFIADEVRQATLSCLTGHISAVLLRLGYGDDPRLWRALDWLVDIQHADGGWLCPYWKAHVRDKHGCMYGTVCALEAFAEVPPERRPASMRAAAARGAEFLLMHRLYRADHHNFEIINPGWLELSFPWFYHYSILRGLWVLARLGYRDERMSDALAVLRDKQGADGRWRLETAPVGRMQVNLEKPGQPSKWITFYSLWTLKLIDSTS